MSLILTQLMTWGQCLEKSLALKWLKSLSGGPSICVFLRTLFLLLLSCGTEDFVGNLGSRPLDQPLDRGQQQTCWKEGRLLPGGGWKIEGRKKADIWGAAQDGWGPDCRGSQDKRERTLCYRNEWTTRFSKWLGLMNCKTWNFLRVKLRWPCVITPKYTRGSGAVPWTHACLRGS